jgi:hypothetical protein
MDKIIATPTRTPIDRRGLNTIESYYARRYDKHPEPVEGYEYQWMRKLAGVRTQVRLYEA